VASGVAPPGSLFAFPRGAQAGTALHSLFEKLDYKRPTGNPELTEAETRRVAKLLLAGGISGGEAAAAAVKLVQTVLAHPLLPDVPAFSLGQLGRRQRAVEVKFHLSVGSGPALTDARLAEALGARVGRIAPQVSLSGYLYGLIDLVFQCPEDHKWYIVDWKSNHLGNRFEDYGPDALQAAMEANHYLLQAHLYTVAWCRHLRLLDPKFNYEQQFGGVAYVFLRGLQPRERTGIWFHKPAWDVVETLGGLL
jgi:exodeoxyribonuclease V beta subunit